MIARNPGRHGLKPLQEQLARLTGTPAWLDSSSKPSSCSSCASTPICPSP